MNYQVLQAIDLHGGAASWKGRVVQESSHLEVDPVCSWLGLQLWSPTKQYSHGTPMAVARLSCAVLVLHCGWVWASHKLESPWLAFPEVIWALALELRLLSSEAEWLEAQAGGAAKVVRLLATSH